MAAMTMRAEEAPPIRFGPPRAPSTEQVPSRHHWRTTDTIQGEGRTVGTVWVAQDQEAASSLGEAEEVGLPLAQRESPRQSLAVKPMATGSLLTHGNLKTLAAQLATSAPPTPERQPTPVPKATPLTASLKTARRASYGFPTDLSAETPANSPVNDTAMPSHSIIAALSKMEMSSPPRQRPHDPFDSDDE